MNNNAWCDEKYPELAPEIKLLWYWIARYKNLSQSDEDEGDHIDRILDEIIRKAKGLL